MEEKLRPLRQTMLEILKVFDKFCREHDLKYSLYAGSLLGAVRHQGFIPWDDDLDVCMERPEYERFLTLWTQSPPEGYVLQNKENSPEFWQSFTKIRKDHTTFLQEQREAGKYHTGIFLDVFPLDRVPEGRMERALFQWHCMKYQLLTREFVPPKAGKPVRLGSLAILACTPKKNREAVRQKTLKKITAYAPRRDLELVDMATVEAMRVQYSPDMADSYVELPFEDGQFSCFAGWDDHLRRKFGEYMQLPPEEDRAWRHHPLIIDFTHNYEELTGNEG